MLKLSRDLAHLILEAGSEAGPAVGPSLDEEAKVGRTTKVGLEQDTPSRGNQSRACRNLLLLCEARLRVLNPEAF